MLNKNWMSAGVLGLFMFCGANIAQAGADFSKSTPDLIAKGKAAFTTNCVVCHGEKMDGSGPAGMALNPKPRNLITEKFKQGDKPAQIFDTISKGVPKTAMAPFAHLPEEDRWALAHYIKSLRKK